MQYVSVIVYTFVFNFSFNLTPYLVTFYVFTFTVNVMIHFSFQSMFESAKRLCNYKYISIVAILFIVVSCDVSVCMANIF